MKRKAVVIICVIAAIVLAAVLSWAIRLGPKASLKRELNISIPENAEIVKYDVGFWRIGYELPNWKIKLGPEEYPEFRDELIISLKGLGTEYKYFDDVSDEEDGEQRYLKRLYEETNGFSGFYDKESEFLWSAYALRGKEPPLIKSMTYIHAVATLGDDGFYYVSIVVM